MFRILIHQTAGIIGAAIVFIMGLTGILLNHRSLIGYNSETSMSMQKFIFALHSGALGNMSIVWLTDLGAVCMIVLSITGVWMWGKHYKDVLVTKRRKRRKHQ